jgi:hypothetical protein
LRRRPNRVAVELNPLLNGTAQLVFSTFIGGSCGPNWGRVIAYGIGQMYLTGGTQSPSFLISHGATQRTCGGPWASGKAFVTVLNPAWPTGALAFSCYFGGNLSETGAGVAVDRPGRFHYRRCDPLVESSDYSQCVAGATKSTAFS